MENLFYTYFALNTFTCARFSFPFSSVFSICRLAAFVALIALSYAVYTVIDSSAKTRLRNVCLCKDYSSEADTKACQEAMVYLSPTCSSSSECTNVSSRKILAFLAALTYRASTYSQVNFTSYDLTAPV